MLASLAASGAPGAHAHAQEAALATVSANPICEVHGEGCSAPLADWSWQRLGSRSGGFSVELPCDAEQTERLTLLLEFTSPVFRPEYTRACMKQAGAFVASLYGYVGVAAGNEPADPDGLLQDAPDLFTALERRGILSGGQETLFQGRRAYVITIENARFRSRAIWVQAGRFGIILLKTDIISAFPATRSEADAAMERFLESLEIAE
jgi:hypothetical protein